MMSEGDGPGVVTAAAAVGAGTPSGGGDNTNTGDSSEMKHVWKFIYIDLSFVKSLYGIFVAAELVSVLFKLFTVKPVNKGHPKERQQMAFKDKWSLFGGYSD